MDVQIIKIVGAVAGIGGLGLGVFLLLYRDFMRKVLLPKMPVQEAYRLLRLFLILVFGIAVVGIAAWVWVETRPKPPVIATKIPADCLPKVSWSQGILKAELHWECQGVASQGELVKANLAALIDVMSQLTRANETIMLPSVEEYLKEPTPERWSVIVSQIELFNKLISETLEKLLKYDASIEKGLDQLPTISAILRFRVSLLQSLSLSKGNPKSIEEMRYWQTRYRQMAEGLKRELDTLRQKVPNAPTGRPA